MTFDPVRPAISLVIRDARSSDAPAIVALTQELAREPGVMLRESEGTPDWTPEQTRGMEQTEREQIEASRAAPDAIILVAETDGLVVGTASLHMLEGRRDDGHAALGLSVKRSCRNRGIGSALLARAIEWAAMSGSVRRIVLDVMTGNAAAVHVYEKSGFRREGHPFRAPRQPGGGGPEFVRMVLDL